MWVFRQGISQEDSVDVTELSLSICHSFIHFFTISFTIFTADPNKVNEGQEKIKHQKLGNFLRHPYDMLCNQCPGPSF